MAEDLKKEISSGLTQLQCLKIEHGRRLDALDQKSGKSWRIVDEAEFEFAPDEFFKARDQFVLDDLNTILLRCKSNEQIALISFHDGWKAAMKTRQS